MVPGPPDPTANEGLPDLREHDRHVLEFLSQVPSYQVAFQGIRRSLGIHPEQLSRALHRLAGDGLVERTEHGYRLTAKALTVLSPDILTRTPEGLTVLETVLPADVVVTSLVDALQGRWFGPLRWFGFSEDEGQLRLWWSTEDNTVQLEVRLHDGRLRIIAHLASRDRLDEAARHAYVLFEHLSREVSRGLYSGLIG
jgi:DNA-binding MarR family transcriptional regulator